MFKKYQLRFYNFRLIIWMILASGIGVAVINSAKDESYAIKQCIGLVVCLVMMFVLSLIDYNWILKYYWVIYAVNIILLLSVKLFGKTVGGAKRWIEIKSDSISIQPSEFAKVFLILFLAKILSMGRKQLNTYKFLLIVALLLMVPIALIVSQPDLSTTVLLCMILFTVLYCAGLSYKIMGIALAILVPIGAILFIDVQQENPFFFKYYQKNRIMAFIDPENYDETSYQQNYAEQAIGSGQLNGKGLNNDDASSIKNAGYIAEAQTDFIFAVVGEELGFVGGCVILLLLALIILECVIAAIRAKDFTGRLICCGMASFITFQTFINIGVATRLLPNTGLPLPFISYGLSSLVTLFGGMGIVLNICLQRQSYDD